MRELISNASDAIDRARFEALTHKDIARDDADWKIVIVPDKEARTLTISDNGIGMNAEELEKHIGTIAHSGTRSFLDTAEAGEEDASEFIGQFGVGFYASFMVADKVTVITRRAGSDEPAMEWTSTGVSKYTMEVCERDDFGTDVILHLREGQDEFLNSWRIQSIVKAYSDFIRFPIVLLQDGGEGKEPGEDTLNSMKALWRKAKAEVTEEEYRTFYHQMGHDMLDPLETLHYHAEGTTEFRALLYIPATPPHDLYLPREQRGLQLYVRNVFITDDCRELLPEYLRFVRGVVDSSDLPLNVSREMLQDEAVIRRINKSLVNKLLSTLKDMKENRPEDYLKFWDAFGAVLKEGLAGDGDQDKLKDLVLYPSTREGGEPALTSLKDYVARMGEEQASIYYLVGDRLEDLHRAPHLEGLRKDGIEVLLMPDPVDEWVMQRLTEYDGKPLKAADRVEASETGADREPEDSSSGDDEPEKDALLTFMQARLDDTIKEVRFSDRLVESACCLVADENSMNPHMERIMRAMNQKVPVARRILELNPDHPLTARVRSLHEQDPGHERLADYIDLLYEQALLAEGSALKDPAGFARKVADLMVKATD